MSRSFCWAKFIFTHNEEENRLFASTGRGEVTVRLWIVVSMVGIARKGKFCALVCEHFSRRLRLRVYSSGGRAGY